VEVVAVKNSMKDAPLDVIRNPESSPELVSDAFTSLYRASEEVFILAVDLLYQYHPDVAKGFFAILPERFIPKDFSPDGYSLES